MRDPHLNPLKEGEVLFQSSGSTGETSEVAVEGRTARAAEFLRSLGWEVEHDGYGNWRYRETPSDWFGEDVSAHSILFTARKEGWADPSGERVRENG